MNTSPKTSLRKLSWWKEMVRWISWATPDFPTKGRWLGIVFRRDLQDQSLAEMLLIGTGGLRFRIAPGSVMGSDLLLYGLYEKDIAKQFSELIYPGDFVVDVGANFGQYTLLAANRLGPEGLVISVEPVPHVYSRLTEHVELNNLSNVRLVQAALGTENGIVSMNVISDENDGMHHVALEGTRNAIQVPQRKLDDLLSEIAPGRPVSLVKIDVEGWEESVFSGAPKMLGQSVPPTIFFESIESHAERFGLSAGRLVEIFRNLGYKIFALDARKWSWHLVGSTQEIVSCNLVACHPFNKQHLAKLLMRSPHRAADRTGCQ